MINPRFALLPLAALQLASAYAPSALGYPSIGTRATQNGIPPELPLGVFFSIWGIIFAAYIAFGIYAVRNDSELSRRLSGPLAGCGVAAAMWMPVQQIIGNPLLDLFLIAPILYASWLAAYRFDTMRGMGGSAIKWTADLLTGLFSGWATVALSISVPRAGRHALNLGPTDAEWISFWSVLATLSIATFIYKRRISATYWYYWAAAWGLLGIMLNNWLRTGFGYFGWITLFFGLWLIYRRFSTPANGAARDTQNNALSPV